MLIMRDGEGKVLTADNIFYNTLSARQALRRHRRWICRRSSTLTLGPTSHGDYFDDVDIPDVVSGTNLLPLPVSNLHYVDMHHRRHRCQADASTTMTNVLCSMYLLTTAIRDTWRRLNWHALRGTEQVFIWLRQPWSWSILFDPKCSRK